MMRLRVLLAAIVLAPLGCKSDPTELLVVVDTDFRVPQELGVVQVSVSDVYGKAVSSERITLVADDASTSTGVVHVPFSIGIVPVNGDPTRLVTIDVEGFGPSGQDSVIVARRAMTGFVKHELRRLDMFLARSCAAAHCTGDQTCTENGCTSSTVPPDSLPSVTAGQEITPRNRPDASAADAITSDAPASVSDAVAGQDAISPDAPNDDASSSDGPFQDARIGDAMNMDAIAADAMQADVGDSGPRDVGTPDGGNCPLTCPGTCTAGDCCTPSCPGGACPSCGANCTCNSNCGFQGCMQTCTSSSTCGLFTRGDVGHVVCESGATCHLTCTDADSCTMDCNGTAQCLMTCGGNCTLNCMSGASMSCPGGVKVCNRACP